jgi:hypothetical protein
LGVGDPGSRHWLLSALHCAISIEALGREHSLQTCRLGAILRYLPDFPGTCFGVLVEGDRMECKRDEKIKEKGSCCKYLDSYEIMSNE